MAELRERVDQLSFPAIMVVFLGLYGLSLWAGVEPEQGLPRAGGAGVAMAILARLTIKLLEHEPPERKPAEGQSLATRLSDLLAQDKSPEFQSLRAELGSLGADSTLSTETRPSALQGGSSASRP